MFNQKELKQDFDRDGYVWIPGFLNMQEVEQINIALEKFIKEVVPTMPS
jgi:phytanoyl-CoA hydroxylase